MNALQNLTNLSHRFRNHRAISYEEGWEIIDIVEKNVADAEKELNEISLALQRAEQTIRNLGNGWLTGDGRTIALNEASNLRIDIQRIKGSNQGDI